MNATIRKVKIISSTDQGEFEHLMNDFLSNRKVYIHDIKYDVIYRGEHNDKVMYSAMIMYGTAPKKPRTKESEV